MDERFGFEGPTQSRGFDLQPFAGDEANAAVYPLPDGPYRRLIEARAILVLGDGTFPTFARAIQAIDQGATVTDNRDMTVRVVSSSRPLLELADQVGALPRSAGVSIDYRDRARFGYDEAGLPFDQGAYS